MAKDKPARLLTQERRREILGVLERNGRVTVEELVKRFGVSAVTARNDLDALSDSGDLIRSHGGGIKPLTAAPEHPLKERESIRHEEKVRIAEKAQQLIRPHETIILCTGSTCAQLAAQIRKNGPSEITVITYALNVASILADVPKVSLVMLGGFLRHPSTAFVGPHAEQMMHSLHADHCFMGAVGVDAAVGLTTLDIMEAQLNRVMLHSASEVTVVADSSKLGRRSLSVISDLKPVRRLITDTDAQQSDLEAFRQRGLTVMTA
jgi:DeoR/GlpR family transcriptional regulator of sugar metabolism